jgi:NAD-specific glutamate dehydrogenase
MARAALRDDLQALQAQLTRDVLLAAPEASGEREAIDAWRAGLKGTDEEVWLLAEACDGPVDLARMSVALRVVRSLLT